MRGDARHVHVREVSEGLRAETCHVVELSHRFEGAAAFLQAAVGGVYKVCGLDDVFAGVFRKRGYDFEDLFGDAVRVERRREYVRGYG